MKLLIALFVVFLSPPALAQFSSPWGEAPFWERPSARPNTAPQSGYQGQNASRGVRNPLGAVALYLGNSLYRIHSTNDEETIGEAASSG